MNENLDSLVDPVGRGPLAREGDTLVAADGKVYPIVKGIPRFVPSENYASDFGAQWNRFPKTQLDSHSGQPITEDRLQRCMGEPLTNLQGKRVLEAGSGAGRFTEVLLKYRPTLHSFDFSSAVEANARNNGATDALTLVQADIRSIPFKPASYDYVVCLGVIQHTPNPEESMRALWSMVRPGGKLVIDHYRADFWRRIPPPVGNGEIPYRWWILRLPPAKRARAVEKAVDFWFPWHWRFKNSRMMQRLLARLSPVKFYYPELRLDGRQAFYEWAVLDTHDATTDHFKWYRSREQIVDFLISLGAENIHAVKAGNGVEARCTKPLDQA